MTLKICVVTGGRADYWLLRGLMQELQESSEFELQLSVTGTHLSPEFGLTFNEIENDGFKIAKKIETILSSDSPIGTSKSIGLGVIGFAEAYYELKPDFVLVLGDRFEVLAAAISAMVSNIPIIHLHGGELTLGAIDDAIRHSITKMSSFHFVATETYRQRVIQLGENPNNVFTIGGLGASGIEESSLLTRKQIEEKLKIKFRNKNLLITFHPATNSPQSATEQVRNLLLALGKLTDTSLIFTMPNGDTESRTIIEQIRKFVSDNENAYFFEALGQELYWSCVSEADGVVGNSSSGVLEVPSLKRATVNIGDRQQGRLLAESIINCQPDEVEILDAIAKIYDRKFVETLKTVKNPYSNGKSVELILEKLRELKPNIRIKKEFYDLEF